MDNISAELLWSLFKNARSWLANLNRASDERKKQSISALRGIIKASRETAVYIREMKDHKARDYDKENHLSLLWTELGFALEDLKIFKLAKRCQIQGKQWSDPDHYEQDFIEKADISLDRMEQLAREILYGLNKE